MSRKPSQSEGLGQDTSITFLFDIIITEIQLTKDKTEDKSKLVVATKFNRLPINITSSRMNVTDFKPGRRIEFKSDPGALRLCLEHEGLSMVVRYSGATLGTAEIKFPPSFTDRISGEMNDIMHADMSSIIRKKEQVGSIEVLCYLTIKCDEPGTKHGADDNKCGNLAKAINPADIMFVVGEPQTCPLDVEPCGDELNSEEGDERLKLDLSRYPTFNSRVTEPPKVTEDVEMYCELKKMELQCEEIIDSILGKVAQLPSPIPDDAFVFTDWSGKPPEFVPKYTERTIPIPLGDIEEMGVKPIRFCPVCLTPMSWLPKYANCPTCNTKPMPEIDEFPRKILTGTEIIEEQLRKSLQKTENYCEDPCDKKEKSESNKADSRCTCTPTKFCAHCRVRNLCSDVIKKSSNKFAVCQKVEPAADEDFCVIIERGKTCRPYLQQVFGELQDIYERKDAMKASELKKRCAKSLLKFEPYNSEGISPTSVRDPSLAVPEKKSGFPTFPHRTVQIGHKTCVKRRGMVSRHHGWAWTSSKAARKYGWRPGAICRTAGTIMKFFLHYLPEHSAFATCRMQEELRKAEPILKVCKKNGEIFITLRPLNNFPMKPIAFKIVKSDLAVAVREIKQQLKKYGFRKCTCHQTVMMCVCRGNMDKKQLESAVQKECKRRGIENCVDHLILTDTSESEMEYDLDISPPTGMSQHLTPIKPLSVGRTTQTNEKDLNLTAKYPETIGPYWRGYNCAAGDRYMTTAFGGPGEFLFEDGVFGFRGGGPHGESAAPGGREKNKKIWGSSRGGPSRGGGRAGYGRAAGGIGGSSAFGGKSFPGPKRGPATKSAPIPVKMFKRHYEALAAADRAKKEAVQKKLDDKKRGTNMLNYIIKKGTVPAPWNPNEPKQGKSPKGGKAPRQGGGLDRCDAQSYNQCAALCCYPSGYYC